jgi:hypothetical protein
VSEAGYSDASYGGTFTFMPITPCAAGSADTVYSLTTADNLTFTDSAPTSNTPAPGSCTGTFGDTLSQTTTETFTYTTTVIGINKKNHNLLHRR